MNENAEPNILASAKRFFKEDITVRSSSTVAQNMEKLNF
jgi:hypothetical protein